MLTILVLTQRKQWKPHSEFTELSDRLTAPYGTAIIENVQMHTDLQKRRKNHKDEHPAPSYNRLKTSPCYMYFLIKIQRWLKFNSLTSSGSWKRSANWCVGEAQLANSMKTTPLLKWVDSFLPSQSSSCLLAGSGPAGSRTGSFPARTQTCPASAAPCRALHAKAAALRSKPPCSNQTGAFACYNRCSVTWARRCECKRHEGLKAE